MKKPNILFIYPDQFRYDCINNRQMKTPYLNRLANESVNFKNAYTSFPLCCPFRASLLTGKYAHKCGMPGNHYPIPLNQIFLPELLNKNGYITSWIGKWHLDGGGKYEYVQEKNRLGFQHFIGFNRGHHYLSPVFYRDNDTIPRKKYMFEPDMQTFHLMESIDRAISENKPFFTAICYGIPHPPLDQQPNEFQTLYLPEDIIIKDDIPLCEKENSAKFLAKYYGLVTNIDHQIGRIITYLEYKNILDNTIIIFCSDHGEMAGEFGIYDKKDIREGAAHVPFLIRYPEKFKAKVTEQFCDPAIDIMPTILEICGINIPSCVQGQSLVQTLMNGYDKKHRDFIYFQVPKELEGEEKFPYGYRGLRTKDYVYLESENTPIALYDLKKDPTESVNYISSIKHYDIIDEYRKRLAIFMTDIEDTWEYEAHFPPAKFITHEEGNKRAQNIFRSALLE